MEKNKEITIYILLLYIQETERISPVRVPAVIIIANVNGECPSVLCRENDISVEK